MSYRVPPTQELAENALTKYESQLAQTAPVNDRAFLRVLSAVQAGLTTGNYKLAAERILQNLALTATGDDLILLGANFGINYKFATSAQCVIQVAADAATSINTNSVFTGVPNGVRYTVVSGASESGGLIELPMISSTPGTVGNLSVGDTMSIEQQVAGVGTVGTITEITELALDDEDEEVYRSRVLTEIRTVGGGGNAVDYRTWAEQAPTVRRAYPYAGKPEGFTDSLPGERTVYIEASEDIDVDGIPTQPVLDEAREYITTDPDTGFARQPLGMTDSTLYTEPITRTPIFVEVRGLQIGVGSEESVKSAIEAAASNYLLRQVVPFVDGVDVPLDRKDTITNLTISTIIQQTLLESGSTASGIGFAVEVGSFLDEYQVGQGELTKLAEVTYA